MASKAKVSKLEMPKKRREEEEFDLGSLGGDSEASEDTAEEGEEELDLGDESAPGFDLAGASDEELMAELKKRGLMSKLEKSEGEESEPEEDYAL